MSLLFLQYPPCSTCKKAKKWLDDRKIIYEGRHIKDQNPSAEELTLWLQKSGLPLKKFFNTSGQAYRTLGLKDKIDEMSEKEQIELLSTDGMLIKRPLLVGEELVLVGFKEKEWDQALTPPSLPLL